MAVGRLKIGSKFLKIGSSYLRIGPVSQGEVCEDWETGVDGWDFTENGSFSHSLSIVNAVSPTHSLFANHGVGGTGAITFERNPVINFVAGSGTLHFWLWPVDETKLQIEIQIDNDYVWNIGYDNVDPLDPTFQQGLVLFDASNNPVVTGLFLNTNQWNEISAGFNSVTGLWGTIVVNGTPYDASASGGVLSNDFPGQSNVFLRVRELAGTGSDTYWDDICLTGSM